MGGERKIEDGRVKTEDGSGKMGVGRGGYALRVEI
jgi:hypothetical protein